MVVACADFCFNVIAFQDEMDADEMEPKKKRPHPNPRGRLRYKKCLRAQEKLASSSQSSWTLVDALQLEASEPIRSTKSERVAVGV